MASPLFSSSEKRSSEPSASPSTARRRMGKNAQLQRRTRNEKLADARTFAPDQNKRAAVNAANHRLLGKGRLLRNLDSSQGQSVKKMQAVAAGLFILWSTLPFYVPQLVFWLVGLAGVAGEGMPLADIVIPGQELFILSYIVIAFIGLCSMAYAVVMFNIRGIDCFSGRKSLYLLICLMGYFVFFINAAPWVLIWVISVMLNQGEEEETSQ